jgi:hypothetical protein
MTRERWEQVLFAHVGDEVVQDMLNQYVLELESSNAKLRELVLARFACDSDACESCVDCQLSGSKPFRCVEVARELCVEVEG